MSIEEQIINLISENNKELNNKDIQKRLYLKNVPSKYIKELLYWDYIVKDEEGRFERTNKEYNAENRKKEKIKQNYEIALNKVFTGSYLIFNLGHEIINFITDDNSKRYVYLNPLGTVNPEASNKTKYVFHIIHSSLAKYKGCYELIGVSEVDNSDNSIKEDPVFWGFKTSEIFNVGEDSKDHLYTFKAKRFLKPKEKFRIVIETNCDEANVDVNDKFIKVNLMCNPQHSMCYADNNGKKTNNSQPNKFTDLEVLEEIIKNYLEDDNSIIKLDEIDGELSYSILSGRNNLENSTSNQIAYFLQRDKELTYKFLYEFLDIKNIKETEKFKIIREENNIDLLFISASNVIVVENKIDSNINGVSKTKEQGKYESQLSKYYDYIEKNYSNLSSHYFILAPEYNLISKKELHEKYVHGDKYSLKNYNELYEAIKTYGYKSLNDKSTDYRNFIFDQFKKSIQYLTWSEAMKQENIAYIRLKQRIEELNKKD